MVALSTLRPIGLPYCLLRAFAVLCWSEASLPGRGAAWKLLERTQGIVAVAVASRAMGVSSMS